MSKERMKNSTRVEGWLYSHKLEKRVTGENSAHPGTEYIRGSVDVATDDSMLNIVTVNYTYVTDRPESKNFHESYVNLSNILNGTLKCSTEVGPERAAKVRLDSAVGVNDFYTDRNGTEELVSAKRNEGGFVRVVNVLNADENQRSTFDCDMIITGVKHVDANEERSVKEHSVVSGYVFNFRKEILPVDFHASNPGAMRYFENLDATEANPVFTRVRGKQISNTVTRQITEESAFGDPVVREVTSSRKEFEITWAQPEEYTWDDPETYTAKELQAAKEARETNLATIKSRADEYKANRGTANTPSAFSSVPVSNSKVEFDF